MKEYVHRNGRLAQAGQAGHAILFLLPSERQYIEVLELRSLRDISPLLLSLTLSLAAALCRGLMQEGESRASTGSYKNADGDDVNPDDGNGRPP
jgi:superfamily II DNA/RNA helicase